MLSPPRQPKSPAELFGAFTRMALMGFGGVLPVAQRELVDRLGWLQTQEFAEMLSVGQVLPGPNIINLALMVGDRFFGLRGALAALAGLLCAPLLLVLVLAALYRHFSALPQVAGALRGMGAVAAGLVVAMAVKLLPSLASNPLGRGACAAATLATVAAIGWLRWPLAGVVLGLGGACCALAWWRLGRRA